MDSIDTSVTALVTRMSEDELDRSIRALTLSQRRFLLRGDLDAAWMVTEDLERCLAARAGVDR